MDNAGFIITSYVITFGAVGAYAIGIIRRSRKSSRDVPRDQRPWS
ncbi:unannotated protein [freshwater metagenome]|uniref:Unannotated protein n=1 Tax=freshwater metagenome TaxID=449393 RepID=A0A6J7RUV6_9ZZZZ